MIAAYRHEDRRRGRDLMTNLIGSLSSGVPKALVELNTLGRTLNKRADDVLAYFDRPCTSNGPSEAINGRLEHLRGSALGFRNLTNYIARSLLETGGFRPPYTLDWEEPPTLGRTRSGIATGTVRGQAGRRGLVVNSMLWAGSVGDQLRRDGSERPVGQRTVWLAQPSGDRDRRIRTVRTPIGRRCT